MILTRPLSPKYFHSTYTAEQSIKIKEKILDKKPFFNQRVFFVCEQTYVGRRLKNIETYKNVVFRENLRNFELTLNKPLTIALYVTKSMGCILAHFAP